MIILRASLFQTLRVVARDGQSLDLGSPTTRSLFAYLLLHRTYPVDRRRLAFIFWPRGAESAARRNLRQYLHRLRKALMDSGLQAESFLQANGTSVQIAPQAQIWLDVEAFQHGTRAEASLDDLQGAVALYSGDLLEDIYEDWCHEERETLRQRYLNALQRLARAMELAGHLDQSIAFTQKRVASEPFDEDAHRDLMRLFALSGDRSRALQQYLQLRETLEKELGAAPLPQTQILFESIQKGELPKNGVLANTAQPPAAPRPLQISHTAPPLVGRQAELSELKKALQDARREMGQFLLITGESGIGKTRLIQEYLQTDSAQNVLSGTCHELELRTPFASLREVMKGTAPLLPDYHHTTPAWLVTLAPLLPSLALRFPHLPLSGTPAEDPNRLSEAFNDLILELCSLNPEAPLHLILDNLHWADSLTWELLGQLSRRASQMPLLIIGLCRLEDLPAEQQRLYRALQRNLLVSHLPLSRLTQPETEQLVEHLIDHRPASSLPMKRFYEETEGNPFFIIETLRAMREAGWTFSFTGSHGMPQGIQRVIEARLDRLELTSRELMGAAAVIGREFTFSFLEEISQEKDQQVIHNLEEWTRRGLVREVGNGYDFSHDKIRQVAYGNLSRARRQYYHRRIAKVLERAIPAADVATLAHHFTHSDQPLKALPYLAEAGEQALRVRSYLEARQFGLQAVSLLGQLPGPRQRSERVDLNLQLAQAYAFTGDLHQAQAILNTTERMAAALGDERRLGKVHRRSAQIFWMLGRPEIAGDYARRTLRLAEELGDATLLQAALRMLGRVGIALSTFDDAIAYLLRYVNLGQTDQAPPGIPIVLGYLGVAYVRVGSLQRGLEAAQRGLELAEKEGASQAIAFARMQMASVQAEQREWGKCLQTLLTIPKSITDENNLTPLGFMILGLRGRALAHLGRPSEGVQIIRTALQWSESVDYRVFHYLPRIFLVECLIEGGEIEPAREQAELARQQAQEGGNRWAVAAADRLLADLLLKQRHPDWPQIETYLIEARNLLRQVRARPDLARTYLALRRLYDRAGQIAWAVDCHFRATTIFEELGMLEELRRAQGKSAAERRGAVVIPDLNLRGPHLGEEMLGHDSLAY